MEFVSEKIKLKKYTSYKYSGSEWIGEIPKDWKVVSNRALFTERNEAGNESLPILSVSIHTAVSNEELSEEDNIQGRNRIADKSNYKLVQPNDIVFNMMRAWQGAIGAVSIIGMVSPAYIVARPNNKIHSGFFEYQYRTVGFIQQIDKNSKGITDFRKRLYWQEFKNLITILPSIEEQVDIASFLDRKTTQIDKAISIKEKQIELLKERRQILIHHAVTRGLNPNVKMKDSGVEWIGEIPEHWEVKRLKFLCHITTGSKNTEDKIDGGKYPFFVRSQTPEAINSYSFDGEAILTAGDGAGVGKVFHYINGKFDFHQRVYKFSMFSEIEGLYLFHYIQSNFFNVANLGTAKSTVDSLRLPLIQDFLVSFPLNIKEQEEIIYHIENAGRKISSALSIKEKEIEKLKEYKATLINSAVTGKIKVS